jgi:hypothetical protein
MPGGTTCPYDEGRYRDTYPDSTEATCARHPRIFAGSAAQAPTEIGTYRSVGTGQWSSATPVATTAAIPVPTTAQR